MLFYFWQGLTVGSSRGQSGGLLTRMCGSSSTLQGLWTFLIYMQPNIIKRKRSSDGNISWFRAFADSLWSSVTGRTISTGSTNSTGSRRNRATLGAPRTAAAPGLTGTNPTPVPGPNDRRGDGARAEDVGCISVFSPDHDGVPVDAHGVAEHVARRGVGGRQLGHLAVRGTAVGRAEDVD